MTGCSIKSGSLIPTSTAPRICITNGRWGNALSVNAEILPTITAAPGERLRLRLVNASNGRIYQLRFGELDAVAIAMDGFYVDRPLPVDGLEIAPGNRVDIDVTIPVDAKGSFVIADSLLSFSPVPLMTLEVSGDPGRPTKFCTPHGAGAGLERCHRVGAKWHL